MVIYFHVESSEGLQNHSWFTLKPTISDGLVGCRLGSILIVARHRIPH